MKPNANKLINLAMLISACACLGFVAFIVIQEIAYIHMKVSKPMIVETPPQQLRWPNPVDLPQLSVSRQVSSEQIREVK